MKKNIKLSLIAIAFFAMSFSIFTFNNANAAFPVAKQATTANATISEEINSTSTSINQDVKLENATMANTASHTRGGGGGKSQLIALILCILVGGLGIHRFYLGYTWQGVVQLLTAGGCGIWALIDLVRIITGDLKPKDGSYEKTL